MCLMKQLMSLRHIDICLVLMFAVFAVAIIVGIVVTSKEEIAIYVYRKVTAITERIESFNKQFSYQDEFDPDWMDAQKYMESKR